LNGRSKQLRTDTRRTEILAGAAGAFRRLGVHKAGMREIAEALGLSTGNLYYYFRNKDELIYYCQDRTLDALIDVAKAAREQYSSRAQLGFLIDGHLRVLLGEQASGILHLEFDDLPPELLKKVVQKRDKYERLVREVIAEARPDAVVIHCTNFRGARAAAAIEAETGVAVLDSVAVALWGTLSIAGVSPSRAAGLAPRWGRVFALA
jgi:AcrR family transcriptional regulator